MHCSIVLPFQLLQLQSFGQKRKIIPDPRLEEIKQESTAESAGSDSDARIGPNSNFSLLDQHSRLKKEAEGSRSITFTTYLGILGR